MFKYLLTRLIVYCSTYIYITCSRLLNFPRWETFWRGWVGRRDFDITLLQTSNYSHLNFELNIQKVFPNSRLKIDFSFPCLLFSQFYPHNYWLKSSYSLCHLPFRLSEYYLLYSTWFYFGIILKYYCFEVVFFSSENLSVVSWRVLDWLDIRGLSKLSW